MTDTITRTAAIDILGSEHTAAQKNLRSTRQQIEQLQQQLHEEQEEFRLINHAWNRIFDTEVSNADLEAWVEKFTGESPEVVDDAPEPECQGHPAGPFDPMGETVYCDGSCAHHTVK